MALPYFQESGDSRRQEAFMEHLIRVTAEVPLENEEEVRALITLSLIHI